MKMLIKGAVIPVLLIGHLLIKLLVMDSFITTEPQNEQLQAKEQTAMESIQEPREETSKAIFELAVAK